MSDLGYMVVTAWSYSQWSCMVFIGKSSDNGIIYTHVKDQFKGIVMYPGLMIKSIHVYIYLHID